ncbi:conserved Plasmodium protein, unknown function [Plasmodium gallinaceum]|uniref:Uncharacterized protein n=1 Tax=Plasmodium gallinaceum TaxID=5849 RepID=A0A1J1GYT3_PLAGA|nr:conserved Plasmodium protein, unknown function [Plasmodium gallinaceum]CRG97730.1 conserved Plasmodium protein, unknown function [Plasmodium gallinaceum]
MIKFFRKNGVNSYFTQNINNCKIFKLNYKYSYNIKRKYVNIKVDGKKKKIHNEELNLNDDVRDIYFNSKLIEKKFADIKIKDSHNKLLFEFLPIEGRTYTVPLCFKIMHYIFLFIISSGVVLIHILPEIDKENYIRDILTLEIYFSSCFLAFNGGFNSLLQLIQYAIPPNRKYKGLYNSLRYISSLIPIFFSLISTSLCENFPRDSLFLLVLSYLTLLLNYYLLHIKCLIPVWVFKQYKVIISIIILNLLLLLISEAQLYKGRKISINVDD